MLDTWINCFLFYHMHNTVKIEERVIKEKSSKCSLFIFENPGSISKPLDMDFRLSEPLGATSQRGFLPCSGYAVFLLGSTLKLQSIVRYLVETLLTSGFVTSPVNIMVL